MTNSDPEPVGDKLHDVLVECGIPICLHECREWQDRMNRWGLTGCNEPSNRAAIIKRLRDKATEGHWWDIIRQAKNAARIAGVIAAGYTSPEQLLDEALRRCRGSDTDGRLPDV